MSVPMRRDFCISGSNVVESEKKKKKTAVGPGASELSVWKNHFRSEKVALADQQHMQQHHCQSHTVHSLHERSPVCIPESLRWWEKDTKPTNMVEIMSADHLVYTLLTAGDKLVVVDFYSPGCGGCRALHPKICRLAEFHPDALFLKVNYEEHKSMCCSLNVHVLPFFRFYRGAQGRVCSFSCTNATIKKLRDALAKHGTERCSLGPAKGLEESELRSLALKEETTPSSSITLDLQEGMRWRL